MLNCIIIEDCPISQINLKNHCNKNESLRLVKSFFSPEPALQFLEKKEEPIDLIFLDIEMPVMSGLQFLEKLQSPPMVIITTSDSTYAFDAFEHQAIDFLVKPIYTARFEQAVAKAIRADALEHKADEIIASVKIIQEEKKNLVSLLAHDLRNPLFSLQLKVAQLKVSQSQDKLATDIETAAGRIQQLTTLILKIEESENLDMYKAMVPIAIKPLIGSVLKHLEILSGVKNLKIGINEVVPDTLVLAEPNLLEHIMENILSNAIKFSPMYGMIEIYIERTDHGIVKVRVIDDGPGIDPEKNADLFHKINPNLGAIDSSLGVGLSLSKKFADLMNIRLGLYNSESFGTTAYLDIRQCLN